MSGPVLLIARREIRTRLQQKGYRVGLGIALLVVVLACTLPALFASNGSRTSYDVGLSAPVDGQARALNEVAVAQGVRVRIHLATEDAVRTKVRSGDWDAGVLAGRRIVARHPTDGAVALIETAHRLATTLEHLRRAGLTGPQAAQALQVAPLPVTTTSGAADTQRQTIAVISVVLLFSQLITFCTWVAMGVVEEKSSRVVEIVLAAVRPKQLLAGKLLGIGALAAGQVLTLGIVALVAGSAAKTLTVPASAMATVVVSFIGFVFAFAVFGALAAALGSTVSRQEEVSGILAPVTITLTVCYGASLAAANSPGSGFGRVLSIVPPISSLAMPARIANGGVAVIDIVLAVVLLVALAVGIVAVAARIYRASVLHSGTRVPLRRAWRGDAVRDLA